MLGFHSHLSMYLYFPCVLCIVVCTNWGHVEAEGVCGTDGAISCWGDWSSDACGHLIDLDRGMLFARNIITQADGKSE